MKLSEVHHVAITVSDLDRSIAFYRDGLGLRVTLDTTLEGDRIERQLRLARGARTRSVYLQGDRLIGQVELLLFDPPAPVRTGAKRPGDPGVFLICFEVLEGEVEQIHQRLTASGARCFASPAASALPNYGTIESFIVEDPDGLLIEIVRLPSRDEIRAVRQASQPPPGEL
jgi:lactoylglutathione lyase